MLLEDLYKQIILEHYKRPHNFGSLDPHSCRIEGNNPSCGDQLQLDLQLEADVIVAIRFSGTGCAISQASASLMTSLIQGKTTAQARELAVAFHAMLRTGVAAPELGDIAALAGIGKLPARVKCAGLAWHTLEQALDSTGTT